MNQADMEDTAFVPVEQEPLHQQRWKSDIVRLVDVQFPRNATCLWHRHLKFGVYICIADLVATEQSNGQEPRALTKTKGDVFCRDHAEDKLIHVVSNSDHVFHIIEVELLKEKHLIAPHDEVPQHIARGLQILNDELECRVYRLTLLSKQTEKISLELPTDAVLVALDECVVKVVNPDGDKEVHVQPGDDVVLVAGHFEVHLVPRDHAEAPEFILVEVF
ncbi:hypothetical protein FI667_g11798, partial [Globisporangium splendens]